MIDDKQEELRRGQRIIISKGLYKGKIGYIYSTFGKMYTIEFEYKPMRKQFTASYLNKVE